MQNIPLACHACRVRDEPKYRAFPLDVMAAILVFQNNKMVAMLLFQTNPEGVELFSYGSIFFCSH